MAGKGRLFEKEARNALDSIEEYFLEWAPEPGGTTEGREVIRQALEAAYKRGLEDGKGKK